MAESATIQSIPKAYRPSDGSSLDNLPWFKPQITNLRDDTRELFERYSKVPKDEVVSHITSVRNRAFQVFPYPCLGHWGFLDLSVRIMSQYPEVLERIKNGDQYLDIGCCVGQDIRKLVYDGAPSENTYGSDLQRDFMDIGYDLFLDKETLKTKFIAADVFDPDSDLKQLDGKIDIIHAASFFHLFNWDEQIQVGKRLVEVFKAKPGCLLIGRQVGNIDPSEQSDPDKSRFRHNPESLAELWETIGNETGTKWEVNSFLQEINLSQSDWRKTEREKKQVEGARWIRFAIRRL